MQFSGSTINYISLNKCTSFGCSVIGSVLIVIGLYSVLWGKHKEKKEELVVDEIPDPVKGVQANGNGNGHSASMIEDIEANEVELQKAEANNKKLNSSVAISMPAAKIHQEK